MLGLSQTLLLNSLLNWTAVQYVIDQHFSNKNIILFYNNDFDTNIFSKMLSKIAEAPSTVMIFNENHQNSLIDPDKSFRLNHFIYLPGKNINESLRTWRRNPAFQAHGYSLFLSQDPLGSLSGAWENARISNAVALTSEGKAYEWQPHGPDECNQVKQIHQVSLDQLYKNKPNMAGCTLKATGSKVGPYFLSATSGVEADLLKMIADKNNVHVQYEFPEYILPRHHWETELNGKLRGAVSLLDELQVDIANAHLSAARISFQTADALYPIFQNEIVWMLKKRDPKQISFYIFSSLGYEYWANTAIIYILISLLFYKTGKSLTKALLRSISVILNAPVLRSQKNITNLLTVLLYILAMHSLVIYQSKLLVSLMTPDIDEIKDMSDAFDRGMHFILMPLDNYNLKDEPAWQKIITSQRWKMLQGILNNVKEIHENNKFISLNPKFQALYENSLWERNSGEKLSTQILPARFLQVYICMFMYKGHPLWPQFNMDTIFLFETGISQHLLNVYLNKSEITDIKRNRDVAITFRQVSGLFFISLFLLIIATGAFLFELIWYRCTRRMQKSGRRKKIVRPTRK